ncbi:MAG: phytanoyl-CoA dioxygenase family protein [Chitinophagales bacterium]
MNSGLIIDENIEKALCEEGVVKTPFLLPEELKAIQNFYRNLHGDNDPPAMFDGIHMTIWCNDIDYKLRIKNELNHLLTSAYNRIFKSYRAISHQFIVKRKGHDTTFPIHQDWSIVDEAKFVSFNMWVPLQDVDQNNGAMGIIKKSHHINRKIRGAGYLFPNYISILPELRPYMTNYAMKAGEALLFYHNTIHGSPANTGNGTRAVLQSSIIPVAAPLHIYFQKDELSGLEVHHPSDDFTYYYKNLREDSVMRPPTTTASEVFSPLVNTPVTLTEVMEAIQATR